MQELRLRAARTACARGQVTWLRDRLLKLGAHVVGSVRRVVLHLPTATPDLHAWRHIALALGARPDRPQTGRQAAHTRSPTANRARPWRSRPWTAPYPGLPHRQSVVYPAGARRKRRPAGRVRDNYTVRAADLEPSRILQANRCNHRRRPCPRCCSELHDSGRAPLWIVVHVLYRIHFADSRGPWPRTRSTAFGDA